MKERVCLSRRPLKGGVVSLFLDYRINGHRRRDNLKMYLYPEKTSMDKAKNNETMRIARAKRDRKEFEIEQAEAGIKVAPRPVMMKFKDYTDKFMERYSKVTTIRSVQSIINIVNSFSPEVYLQEMDSEYFKRLVKHMEGRNPNTIVKHVSRIMTMLKQAKYDGIINDIPKIDHYLPHQEEVIREFLTMDELRILDATPCDLEVVKQAFLFSCFTGLRYSDIVDLKASMMASGEIIVRQHKTGEPVRIPISENALKYLPEGYKETQFVFNLPKLIRINDTLKKWAKTAGIEKNLHYHLSRHTFGTLMVSSGADLYVTQRIMGHKSINTTAHYAKVVDEARRRAIELIPKI